jgi:glycerophosphoryl diester phosphodiesterase
MMTPSPTYIKKTAQMYKKDTWASQIKVPGEIGLEHYGVNSALRYNIDGSAYFDYMDRASYVLGGQSFPTFPTNGYRISFDMKFQATPAATLHAGIAFGKLSDDLFRQSVANASGGYHLAIRGSGTIDLLTHAPGVANGTIIASGTSGAAVPANTWMTFQVDVTPTQVIVRRTDITPGVTITANNTTYRGGYVHLTAGTVTDVNQKPYWRNFSVTPL